MRKWKSFIVTCLACILSGCCEIRPPKDTRPIERTLEVTGYCKCGKCCGWRRNWYGRPIYSSGRLAGKPKKVGVTASGTRAGHGTIAADTTRYPFGTVMYVDGYGYGRVEDVGGAIKGDRIDLYFNGHTIARKWGKKRIKVKIWLCSSASNDS